MAYTVGSAKDARQDKGFTEADVLGRFVARQAEIEAFKRKYGGDLENAYQRVTGEAWPAGRSVKIKNGRAEMTKDRTLKSVALKYVAAPAAIAATAAFAPGALPAIGHALASGATAAGHAVGIGSAAGTAASAAPAAATAAKASLPWLRPLLQYGVPAATQLVGQKMAANADTRATEIQTDYLNRALDVEKENQAYTRGERANYLARLKPYNDAGTAAVGRASGLLTGGGPASAGATVRLKAPDGSTSDVPAALADHYISRGAMRV